jgi:hypothetical protein
MLKDRAQIHAAFTRIVQPRLLPVLALVVLLSGCAGMNYMRGGYPNSILYQTGWVRWIVLGIGLLFLLAGFAIYEFMLKVLGFFTGAALGVAAGYLAGDGETIPTLIGLVLGGLVGAGLALFLAYLGIFLAGGWGGAMLASSLWAWLFNDYPPDLVWIAGGIIGGIILVALYKLWIVAMTSALGAFLVVVSLDLGIFWWVLLLVLGIVVQNSAAKRSGKAHKVRPAWQKPSSSAMQAGAGVLAGLGAAAVTDSPSVAEDPAAEMPAAKMPSEEKPPAAAPLPVTPAGLHSAYLQISGRQVPVRDGLVIGRGSSCDLVLDDPQAGDRHALIRLEGEQWLLQDLGTPGGTLVNGARLTTLPLSHGDQIQIGNSTLVFNFVHQGS